MAYLYSRPPSFYVGMHPQAPAVLSPYEVGVKYAASPEAHYHIKTLKPPPNAYRHALKGQRIKDEKKPDDFVPASKPSIDARGGAAKSLKGGPVTKAAKQAAQKAKSFFAGMDEVWMMVQKPSRPDGAGGGFDFQKKGFDFEDYLWG